MAQINKADLLKGHPIRGDMRGKWTGDLVINRLEAAFRMNPNAAMFSAWPDFPSEGVSIEGIHLIQATALALGLDSSARIHLLYHARSRGTGESIYKLCQNRFWKRTTHRTRVIAASIAVAEWLNARSMRVPMRTDISHASAKRGPGRPPTLGRLGST
jgi:hypothetical protein